MADRDLHSGDEVPGPRGAATPADPRAERREPVSSYDVSLDNNATTQLRRPPARPYDPTGYDTDAIPRTGPPAVTAGTPPPTRQQPPASPTRQQPPAPNLPPYQPPQEVSSPTGAGRIPRKITVTRVAALRSRELTSKGVKLFQRAAKADGADKSGLTSLTYAVMANYAVDAALAVALANTLFFAAAKAESTGKVLLYLLITVAPFAVLAPLIGPALDKLQRGRRIALAVCGFGRALLAVIIAFKIDSWLLYPCALGMLVLSKSFGVLKASLTPRVLPEQITLVKTNSRLAVFGLIAGGVAGALAAGFAAVFSNPGALVFTALCGVAAGVLALQIPAWVERTEGEVPLHYSQQLPRPDTAKRRRTEFPSMVRATLWATAAIRIETGFLTLFIAFVTKAHGGDESGWRQMLVLGLVGAAAGIGGFVGNAVGAHLQLNRPHFIALSSLAAVTIGSLLAAVMGNLMLATVMGLLGSGASSLAKVSLDAVVQHHLPEESRASAFGLSETALQLTWVLGGVIGLLVGGVITVLPSAEARYGWGYGIITILMTFCVAQSLAVIRDRSLLPARSSLLGLFRRGRAQQSTPTDPAGPPLAGYPHTGQVGPAGSRPGPATAPYPTAPYPPSGYPKSTTPHVTPTPARRSKRRRAGEPR